MIHTEIYIKIVQRKHGPIIQISADDYLFVELEFMLTRKVTDGKYIVNIDSKSCRTGPKFASEELRRVCRYALIEWMRDAYVYYKEIKANNVPPWGVWRRTAIYNDSNITKIEFLRKST